MGGTVSPFMAFVPGPYQEAGLESLRGGLGRSRVGRYLGAAAAAPIDILKESAQGAVRGIESGVQYALEDPEAGVVSPATAQAPPVPQPPPATADVGADALRLGSIAATPPQPRPDPMLGLRARAFNPEFDMPPAWGGVKSPEVGPGVVLRPVGQMAQDEAAQQALDAIYGQRSRAIDEAWQERYGPQIGLERMAGEREAEEMMVPQRPATGEGGAFVQSPEGVYRPAEPQAPVGVRRRIEAAAAPEVAKTKGFMDMLNGLYAQLDTELQANVDKIMAEKGLSPEAQAQKIRDQIARAQAARSLIERSFMLSRSGQLPGQAFYETPGVPAGP
jgi:hypothetical protein